MPRIEIKVRHMPEIRIPGFSAEQMGEIAQYAIDSMLQRNAQALDIFDQPAPPLTPKYAKLKQTRGKQPVRDLRLSGNMLGSIQVVEVDESHAKVKLRGATPYRKALWNQNLDPWFGLSPDDHQHLMQGKVEPIFTQNLQHAMGLTK